jgi:hypothetical protein
MHNKKQVLALLASLTLIGAYDGPCDPEKDPGDWEPYPVSEEEPVLFCQEACEVDADCTAGTFCSGACDPDTDVACGVLNRCVDCKADANCTDPLAPFCVAGSCVSCVDDSNCPGTAPRCLDGTCTCNASVQCEPDERCMYTTDAARDSSVPGCVCWENSACAGIGPETCIAGICIECEFDAHCEATVGAGSTCIDGGTLYAMCTCVGDGDCNGGFCDGGSCVDCLVDGDCGGGKCDGGSCVECLEDADCTFGTGATCVDGWCSCGDAAECTATASNPATAWVCEE